MSWAYLLQAITRGQRTPQKRRNLTEATSPTPSKDERLATLAGSLRLAEAGPPGVQGKKGKHTNLEEVHTFHLIPNFSKSV